MSTPGGNGVFMSFSGGSAYSPGVTQSVIVTVIDAFQAFGYQTSPRISGQDATQGAGTLSPVDANAQFYPAAGSSTLGWIAAGEGGSGAPTNTFHFKWTPPASGTVDFYVIGMGGNGTGGPEPNEHVYANRYTLTPAPPPPAIAKPSFTPGSVVSAAANVPGLTPGAWLAIYGTNLAQSAGSWSGADFSAGRLPTSLNGVAVTVDGKPAAVYYVAPAQIDVQVPDDAARGPVAVVVTSGQVSSDPVMVNMASFAPSFFMLDAKYIAATHADNTPITAAAPAKPGEIIVLYGTGFGPSDPPTQTGIVFSGANPLAATSSLNISIAGSSTEVDFAGITAAGLYQFNVTLPVSLPDGDAQVVATVNNAQTQEGAYIAIHH